MEGAGDVGDALPGASEDIRYIEVSRHVTKDGAVLTYSRMECSPEASLRLQAELDAMLKSVPDREYKVVGQP